jgi:hypothetical protein
MDDLLHQRAGGAGGITAWLRWLAEHVDDDTAALCRTVADDHEREAAGILDLVHGFKPLDVAEHLTAAAELEREHARQLAADSAAARAALQPLVAEWLESQARAANTNAERFEAALDARSRR